MNTLTFEQRCTVAQQCLPPAPYRGQLTVLHNEMLARIAELEAGTQPTAKPVEIDGIKPTKQTPLMVWENGAPVDLAAAAADALKWLDLLDKMVGMGRAKFTDHESRNLLGNARANLAQFLPPDARTKQAEDPVGQEA